MENEQLMERIRNGEDSLFAKLIHPHIDKAYRTSYIILRSKDQAEEVVQNAMIEAYRNIMEGKTINFFPTWFNRLVTNRSIDMMRKHARLKENTLESYHQGTAQSVMETILAEETHGEILNGIQSLENPDYRNVLLLYYYQELTIQEVADMLHLNLSTVKSHLRRARNALKTKLVENKVIGV
ncbi:RNA polymerase sigma factor [Cytobacillus sp. FJAT-54145]|uniref:RNA polymerase sigma factor n=1 Tax=Cytobacillus spartinae TaxID=3299023 RepID=A0ABW6K6Q7_9BACI